VRLSDFDILFEQTFLIIQQGEDMHEVFQPNPEFSKTARIKSMDEYWDLVKASREDFEGFWDRYAKEKIDWVAPYEKVLDESDAPFYKWFVGGKLNVTTQCIDRHLPIRGEKTAILFEGEGGDIRRISYNELQTDSVSEKVTVLFCICR